MTEHTAADLEMIMRGCRDADEALEVMKQNRDLLAQIQRSMSAPDPGAELLRQFDDLGIDVPVIFLDD